MPTNNQNKMAQNEHIYGEIQWPIASSLEKTTQKENMKTLTLQFLNG